MLGALYEISKSNVLIGGVWSGVGIGHPDQSSGQPQGVGERVHGATAGHRRHNHRLNSIDFPGCSGDYADKRRVQRSSSWIFPLDLRGDGNVAKAVAIEVPPQLDQHIIRALVGNKTKIELGLGNTGENRFRSKACVARIKTTNIARGLEDVA